MKKPERLSKEPKISKTLKTTLKQSKKYDIKTKLYGENQNSVYYLNTSRDRNLSTSNLFSAGDISKDSNGYVIKK
jgi:hypothetical protein